MPFDLLFLSLCVVLTTLSNSQQCAPSYSFNSQRCISCQQNCICKTEHTCDSCIAGATFDVLFKQCLQCPPYVDPTNVGCLECCPQVTGTAFVCSSCPTGSDIYLIGGQCISKKGCSNITDNGSCTACFASYYIALGSCIPCHISCASCNYQTLCLTCALGYYNASNVDYSLCQSCPVNCASCSTASTCTNCSAGYYLSTSTCLACSQNCLQCTGPSCTTCNSQSGLISGVCQLCSTGCISCTSDSVSVHCTACSGGYYLNANTRSCVSCASTFPNSILCSQTGAQQCSQDSNPTLTARYYLMSGSCVQNIHSCKDMLDSLGNCATCYFDSLVGFYTLTSGSCVRCNVNGCSNYSSICQCLQCSSGWQFVNGQCFSCLDQNCYSCQTSLSTCSICATTYGLYSLSCIPCTPLNCENCDQDYTVCNRCKTGYYLSGTLCYPCQLNCLSCTSNTLCTACSPSSYLQSNGRCKKMPTNCLEIDPSSTNSLQGVCKLCRYGYYVQSGICLPCSPSLLNLDKCSQLQCQEYYDELMGQHLLLCLSLLALLTMC